MTVREAKIAEFLAAAGWGDASRATLAGDASFRRYDRLRQGAASAVLMDAPPPLEDVRPFVRVARRLRALGLSAPEILAEDDEAGLLLLEDFGDATYTAILDAGGDERRLYALAVETLIALHKDFAPVSAAEDIPPYDDARLLDEACLFTDWYLPAIRGRETSAAEREAYCDLWRAAFVEARMVPDTLVLRDFHVDNLIWLEDRPGVAACGLLDFQDAVVGPIAYDLVSLFEDARRDVPPALAAALLLRYQEAFPGLDVAALRTSYAVLGAQRSAKILGIFTRLDRRDGKPDYLHHIPRVWRWLEGDLAHPVLAPIRDWIDAALPAERRAVPDRKSP